MENILFTIDPDKEFEPTISALEKMPKSCRVVKAIRDDLKAKQRIIREKYDQVNANGRSDEENADEIAKLQSEARQVEEDALEAVKTVQINTVLKLQDQVSEFEERRDKAEKQLDKVVSERKAELAKADKEKAVKIYPNDPCPCGSGKKYKKCCGG